MGNFVPLESIDVPSATHSEEDGEAFSRSDCLVLSFKFLTAAVRIAVNSLASLETGASEVAGILQVL